MRRAVRQVLLGGGAGTRYAAVSLPVAPYAYYGVLRLSTWTGNCVDLIRASDSAALTVGFKYNCLDIVQIRAWGTGTTVSVTKWYDQSGNGFDATQSGSICPTVQPALVLNNMPALHFNAQYMTLPAGLSTTQNAVSGFMIYRAFSGYFASGGLELGTTTPIYSFNNQSNNYRFRDFGSTPNYGRENPYDVRLFSFLSGGTNVARLNEVVNTITTAAASAMTGGLIGRYSTTPANGLIDVQSVVIYNSALSSGNHSSVRTALYTGYNIYSTTNGPFVVWDGDSITNGGFNEFRSYVDPAMRQLSVLARCINNAQTGQTLAQMATNYASRCAPMYSASNSKNVLLIFGGTNDIAANVSAATAFSSLLTYAAAARATGYKVIVGTMLARTQGFSGGQTAGGFETARQTFNASIASDALTHWDGVADFAAVPNMNDATNLTYWNAGGIHPNDAGNTLLAPVASAAVNAWL